MTFNSAPEVEQLLWTMRLADWPRSINRTKINDLFNGLPPYSPEEVAANQIAVNVNPLGGTRLAHDARSQFSNAFMKPGKFFHCRTDYGKPDKRAKYNTVVTSEVNRIMKRSPKYFEVKRSKFAQLVLHGIGPAARDDRDRWCPQAVGVEDVLIPSNTTLDMDNLPFFAVYRSYTGAQLRKLTSGPKVDKAWNMRLVNYMIKWVDSEGQKLLGTTWPEVWSPEKMAERIKGDGGLYASDAIPTIDCYDFYYRDDKKKETGWRRRIVLDAYGSPGVGMSGTQIPDKGPNKYSGEGWDDAKGFLYDPGDRVYASHLSELINFQFADLSAVAPFRYHSVRSLGFLIWAVCHLQNRLYCKIQEATFESLLQYFRVKSMDDVERALKIELVNRGFIDESINFIKKDDRWQTDARLAELAYGHNEQIISQNSSSLVPNKGDGGNSVEKRHLQVLAELNATTQLVSAALMQAYQYEVFEYREDFRRFCKKNSRDPDVREFRNNCLKAGVPEEVLVPEAWDISSEQVMGGGNKTMEMTIAQQLLQMRPLYDPEPQREILRLATLGITDNASITEMLVPDQPEKITDSVHDAQLATGTLMMGLPVAVKTGMNHIEYVETLLANMALVIHRIEQRGGMAEESEIVGLGNMAKHVQAHIQIIAQDDNEKQRVKQYGDELGKLMNMVKGYAQRLQEQRQQQAQQGPQLDPKDVAKIKGMELQAQVKAKNTSQSHAAKTAQRQISFEQTERQRERQHQQDLAHKAQDAQIDIHKKAAETVLDLKQQQQRGRMRSVEHDDA